MKTQSRRNARQRPGSTGDSAAAAISHSGKVTQSSTVSSTTSGARTTRRSSLVIRPARSSRVGGREVLPEVVLRRLVGLVDPELHGAEVPAPEQRVVTAGGAARREHVRLDTLGQLGHLADEPVPPGD